MLENEREQLIEEGEKRGGEMMNREEATSRKIERGREKRTEGEVDDGRCERMKERNNEM